VRICILIAFWGKNFKKILFPSPLFPLRALRLCELCVNSSPVIRAEDAPASGEEATVPKIKNA